MPDSERLQQAATLINEGKKVAILVGQGAIGARDEVTQLAMKLNAPVAKALLGKGVLADDSPYACLRHAANPGFHHAVGQFVSQPRPSPGDPG